MAADFDDFLEQQRAARYDGGDEDECNNDEEDEQGERADEQGLYSEGHERRARIEQSLEDDERCLKSWRDPR